jgi:peptide/nickel transport system ATP-binding protein
MIPLLKVENLKLHSRDSDGLSFLAVDGVSFELNPGEILGITGQIGSGKSSLAQGVTGFLRAPLSHTSGEVRIEGKSIFDLDASSLRCSVLGKKIALIPQNAILSLPRFRKIKDFALDVVRSHYPNMTAREAGERIQERFRQIGLEPNSLLDGYPSELTPLLAPQVVIAVATLMNPAILIVDELTSQPGPCMDLLLRIKSQEIVRSLILCSKNSEVLKKFCTRIAVMCAGEFVEQGATEQIIEDPKHPYTQIILHQGMDKILPLTRTTQSCRFASSCPHAQPDCYLVRQLMRTVADRDVKCMYAQ